MSEFITNEKLKRRAEANVDVLREKRKALFKAFDILKTNKAVGIDEVDELSWEIVVQWYRACLDLEQSAIENPPSQVVRYL